VALAAVAMGACIIEKHLTLDASLSGPDHAASLEPGEFHALVRAIRTVEAALGEGIKEPRSAEADTRRVARRSLFLRQAVRAGDIIEAGNLIALRPADGISPADLDKVAGRPAARALAAGSMLTWDLVGARPAVRVVAD
jgi:N-acetylneuraminate synthase/N,N'-diacetyllegionaminate synthase